MKMYANYFHIKNNICICVSLETRNTNRALETEKHRLPPPDCKILNGTVNVCFRKFSDISEIGNFVKMSIIICKQNFENPLGHRPSTRN